MCVGTFQPRNFTGWGSEGVKHCFLTNSRRNRAKNCCVYNFCCFSVPIDRVCDASSYFSSALSMFFFLVVT